MPIIAVIGIFAAVIGALIASLLLLANWDYFSILIGTTILACIYIKEPNSFFLSNTKISAIILLNSVSKIPYLVFGEDRSKDLDLASVGLGGIISFLQEILNSEKPPTRLLHGDKGFLLEHDIKNKVTAIIIADQINETLRVPLKFAITLFTKHFKQELATWDGLVSQFDNFKTQLYSIFSFAFPMSKFG